jgi:acyl-CoA synthetase (AMP-forming)/AMP-acid ligase II
MPDAARGEVVVAIVGPASGATFERDQVLGRLREQLSHFKVPHFVFAMAHDDIPRTDSSKVKKHLLKEVVRDRWVQLVTAAGMTPAP